jgi:hypothetical protein
MTDAPTDDWAPRVLSPDQIREIERRWPNIEAYQIDRLAEGYQSDVDWRAKWRNSGDMRSYLDGLAGRCVRLQRVFASPDEDLHAMLRFGERRLGLPETVERTAEALAAMTRIIAEAKQHVPSTGGPAKPDQAVMFEDLRDIIADAGYRADRSPEGPLMQITATLLTALGVAETDASSLVHYQLKRLKALEKAAL